MFVCLRWPGLICTSDGQYLYALQRDSQLVRIDLRTADWSKSETVVAGTGSGSAKNGDYGDGGRHSGGGGDGDGGGGDKLTPVINTVRGLTFCRLPTSPPSPPESVIWIARTSQLLRFDTCTQQLSVLRLVNVPSDEVDPAFGFWSLTATPSGVLLVTSSSDRIWQIDPRTGVIEILCGFRNAAGVRYESVDGDASLDAKLFTPYGIALDPHYYTDPTGSGRGDGYRAYFTECVTGTLRYVTVSPDLMSALPPVPVPVPAPDAAAAVSSSEE